MKVSAKLVKELRDLTAAGMMDCKKALEANEGDIQESVKWLREKGITKAAKKANRVAAEGLCSYAIKGNEAVVFELNCETDFVSQNAKFLALVDELGKILINSTATNTEEALEVVFEGEKVSDKLVNGTATLGEKISLRRVSRISKTDSQVFGAYKHGAGSIMALVTLEGGTEEIAKNISMHVAAINPRFLESDSIPEDVRSSEEEIIRVETLNENAEAKKPKPEKILVNIVKGRLNKFFKENCLLSQSYVKEPDLTVDQYVKNNKTSVVSYVRLGVGEGIEKEVTDFAAEVAAQAGLN